MCRTWTPVPRASVNAHFRILWNRVDKVPCKRLEEDIIGTRHGMIIVDSVGCFPGIMIGVSLAANRTLRADAIANGISVAFPDSKRPICSGRDVTFFQSDQDETDETPGSRRTASGGGAGAATGGSSSMS